MVPKYKAPRNSLLWVENGSEELVLCNEHKLPLKEVYMEPFHPPPIMDNASLSICAYLFSVLANDQDAKATSLSLQQG